MNKERDTSRIARSQAVGSDEDSPQQRSFAINKPSLLRSLFIDGQRAHARLRLPIRGRASDRPVHQPVNVPGRDTVPLSALLTTRPLAGGLDDLEPSEGDLVPFTFRLLSAAYLGSGGYHLDFSREGVLEQSLALFMEPEEEASARQSPLVVVRDHSFSIEDRIGLVRNARWSPVNPDYGLPYAGIDAELHIDWKLAGDVVRRLLHDPPLLDACSVSLGFGWEKSHPQLDDQQFWQRLGEELDPPAGGPVRVVVTEILSVEHVGLVFAGADPSARRTSPSARRKPATAEPTEALDRQAIMTTSLAKRQALQHGSGQASEKLTEGGNPLMEEKNVTLTPDSPVWKLLGVEQPDLNLLVQRAGELKRLAELGREALADLRREVESLIVQMDGAAESEPSLGLLKMVQAADAITLKALKDEYARRLESLFPARCQVCGSEQVSRRSSREKDLVDHVQGSDDPTLYR